MKRMSIVGHAGMLGADPAATEGLPPILELPPADGEMVHRFMRRRVRSDAWSSESMLTALRVYGREVQQAEREKAAAALTLVQAERDAMQQERDELRAECDGLFVALAELLSAEQTPMPPAAAGLDAQTAWAERQAAARDNASRALTPKATQQAPGSAD